MTAASLLLDCWEGAGRVPAPWRALGLLLPASGGADIESLAALSVGRRDSRLLDLRQRLFGDEFEAMAECPSCGLAVELTFDASNIRAASPPDVAIELRVGLRGWAVQFRLPDSRDLMATASCAGAADAVQVLIDRCVIRVTRGSRPRRIEEAPAELIERMEEEMARLDPQADIRLKLSCPGCGAAWDGDLDVAAFVTTEISTGARRLLREIHSLAGAYGWSEAEILGLGPRRRQAYLELAATE